MYTVKVADANDDPVIQTTGVPYTVAENSQVGSQVLPVIRGLDEDAGQKLTFEIVSQPASAPLAITKNDDASAYLTVQNPGVVNYESIEEFDVTVKVKDDGVPSASSTLAIKVKVTDVNEKPSITPGQSLSVDENTAVATVLAHQFTATDPDTKNAAFRQLSWQIVSCKDASRPLINITCPFDSTMRDGRLMIINPINYEEGITAYELQATVSDISLTSTLETIQITINDLPEDPTIKGGQ